MPRKRVADAARADPAIQRLAESLEQPPASLFWEMTLARGTIVRALLPTDSIAAELKEGRTDDRHLLVIDSAPEGAAA